MPYFCFFAQPIKLFTMVTRIQKHLLFAVLTLVACFAQAQTSDAPKTSWLSDKPKKILIELKAGRGFLSTKPSEGAGYAKVFYGGANMSFGLMLRNNFLGLGAGGEYVDMPEGSFDFPIFLNFQHYFTKDMEKGFFAGGKVGYLVGGKKSIEDVFDIFGNDEPGTISRAMKGFYGELLAGYRIRGVNLFVAYTYRVIGYGVTLSNPIYEAPYDSYSRDLHVIMAGVSFMPF